MPINNTSITKTDERHGNYLESVQEHLIRHLTIV